MSKPPPFFTLITVCLNSKNTLERTISSVRNQTFNDFEYIIVDGGSSDGSLDIINSNRDIIDLVVSEKDKGIYDAMNKGIRLAKGEFIGIINSDDWYEVDALANIYFEAKSNPNAVIHGLCRFYNQNVLSYIIGYHHSSLPNNAICHPTCFVPRFLYDQFNFYDTKYKIAADYDFFLRLFLANVPFVYVEKIIANFLLGGTSSSDLVRLEAVNIRYKYRQITFKRYMALITYNSFYIAIHYLNRLKNRFIH